MRCAILGFTLGILLLQQQSGLLPWPLLAGLIALAGLGVVLVRRLGSGAGRTLLKIFCGALLGWSWASLLAWQALERQLAPVLEEQDLVVIGVVSSLPSQSDYGERFQFQIEQLVSPGHSVGDLPRKVLLSWNEANGAQSSAPMPAPGERWQLTVRLRRPHGLANPHGFDYEVWLLEQGLGASGSVRLGRAGQLGAFPNRRLQAFVLAPANCIEWVRSQLRAGIQQALPDQSGAGIIAALVIGEQGGITAADWQLFARTGINHLVAISGLHISMLAGLGYRCMLYLWRHSFYTRRELPLLIPAQKMAALFSVLIALAYVALAGFGVPAQRALVMIAVVALALWSGRRLAASQILALALLVVVVLDPWAVLWPGFWLSFAAVGLIFFVSPGAGSAAPTQATPGPASRLTGWLAGLREAARVQYAITLGLVPLTLLLFNQISLISPLANALAIPVVSALVTPLALLGSLMPGLPGDWILQASVWILQLLLQALRWLSEVSWAVWQAPRPPVWMALCALAGVLWSLAPRGWPWRWGGLLTWLPLLLNAPVSPAKGEFSVTALDIGQGMALLVETAGHRLLYDTGPAYSPTSDAGSRVIYPYLKARGIRHLDGLLISHHDNDHSGGAISLMQQLQIDWVLSSLDLNTPVVRAAQQTSQHLRCQAGQHWVWDGIDFELLHPTPSVYASDKWRSNARSCTLKISRGAQSILLAGDIEATQENELVHSDPQALASTVLLAPHHGSATSSTNVFLQAVHPRWAIFQFGYHNRYHHPHPAVWQRYADLGIERLRNDDSGALTLYFGQTLRIEEYRRRHPRYWYPAVSAAHSAHSASVEPP